MKLRWFVFLISCFLAFAFFTRIAEHKNRLERDWTDRQIGKGLDFFLGPKAARHFQRSELRSIYAGLLPQGARQTGHFGILLEFEDQTFILAHKGPNQYAASGWDMLRLIARGMKQRVEILQFADADQLKLFANTIGWKFVRVDVEEPQAVKLAFMRNLDRFYAQSNQWLYSLVQDNCMVFGIDLIEAGKPLYWSRADVFSVIPADAFANIKAAEPGSSL